MHNIIHTTRVEACIIWIREYLSESRGHAHSWGRRLLCILVLYYVVTSMHIYIYNILGCRSDTLRTHLNQKRKHPEQINLSRSALSYTSTRPHVHTSTCVDAFAHVHKCTRPHVHTSTCPRAHTSVAFVNSYVFPYTVVTELHCFD